MIKNFKITTDFKVATHWEAKIDERYDSIELGIKLEKKYPLIWNSEEKDFFIKDENSKLSMVWLYHNGDLLEEIK